MRKVIIPAREATKEVEMDIEDAIAFAGKEVDHARNVREAFIRVRDEQSADEATIADVSLTAEQKVILEQAADLRVTLTPRAKELAEYLKDESRPKPDDFIKKPEPEPAEEVVEAIPALKEEGEVLRG